MKITILIRCNNLFTLCQRKLRLRRARGIQILLLEAQVRFQNDESNVMLLRHRMGNASNLYFHEVADNLYLGNVLFLRGIHRSGNKLLHLLTAAKYGYSLVIRIYDDVLAMIALIKFHTVFSFLFYHILNVCYFKIFMLFREWWQRGHSRMHQRHPCPHCRARF